jgi:transglutaminase-like putative cysteine protease
MASLLIHVLQRTRPREGWLTFILVMIAVLCAPAALVQATGASGMGSLVALSLLAALTGLGLARSRLAGRTAALVGGLLGGAAIVVALGGLIPPLSLVWAEIGYGVAWAQAGLKGAPPLAASTFFAWQRLSAFGGRLWGWGQAVAGNEPVPDQIGFLLLTAFLIWAVACFAAWQIYRRQAPLGGLLPGGIAVAMVMFLTGSGRHWLLIYLFCTLALIAAVGFQARQQRWEKAGIDYPGDLGLDLGMIILSWMFVAVLVAAAFPYIRSRQLSGAFWQVMERPWSAVERVSVRLFGEIESQSTGGFGRGELPRDHLLAGGPDLSKVIVLYVTTSDPPPPLPEPEEPAAVPSGGPRRYWRMVVYDTYTGHGWQHSQLQMRGYQSDQPLHLPPPGRDLRQKFTIVRPVGRLYAANEPLTFDVPVRAWWQSPGDLAFVEADAESYSVISRPPEPSAGQLRAAAATLPPDVAQRYLALPDTLPARVRDLAGDLAEGASDRYDQARAIESYLRTYTYTLEVPTPPPDRDVADYFLFDLKKGYCDYYASAMVVMARAIGIPARLAVGYAQGSYDYENERWVVTEMDAHSWPEVYFDGIGWVEFEPTAGQPPLLRPASAGPGEPAGQPSTPAPLLWGRIPGAVVVLATLAVLAGALVLLVALVRHAWLPRKAASVAPAELVQDRYERLLHWGKRLGRPLNDGQTPYEYSRALGETLSARGEGSRWRAARDAASRAPAEVQELADSYVRSQYAPRPLDERERWRIYSLWERLRRHLSWLLLH